MRLSSRHSLHAALVARSCSHPARTPSSPAPCSARSSTTRNEPIAGVKITLTNPESPSFKQEETTDDRGRYTIFVANALPLYTIAMSKEGYQSFDDARRQDPGPASARAATST